QRGSPVLSGAVGTLRALPGLSAGRKRPDELPFYGQVEQESVYFLTRRRAVRIPTPPTMHNHGNRVASLAQLGRWLAEQADEAGALNLPGTAATKLLVDHGRARGIRTGDKSRGPDRHGLPNLEAGAESLPGVTILAEGTQGHPTGAGIQSLGLGGENPQVWALGVKEVWRVAKPLRKVVHTLGWPLRAGAKYREFGGSFIYPMGDDLLTLGMVVGLDYR